MPSEAPLPAPALPGFRAEGAGPAAAESEAAAGRDPHAARRPGSPEPDTAAEVAVMTPAPGPYH
ncbi:MAG TPA: SH3 domain-containing protein, partial [Pseudomonadota bacterium]|nr:SH3 domain-containing protein [Pseudomonadota bacterium]